MITTTAPYANYEKVIQVLEKYRETKLGGKAITSEIVMKLCGGSDQVAQRIVTSLKTLELLDDDWQPADALIQFGNAKSDEYKPMLAAHLRAVYKPVFDILGDSLSEASSVRIQDQFIRMTPATLRNRMASCFTGLCEYAEIIDTAQKPKSGPKPPRNTRQDPATPNPAKSKPKANSNSQSAIDAIVIKGESEFVSANLSSGGQVVVAVSGKLSDLTASEREKVFELIDLAKALAHRPALGSGSTPNSKATNG